MTASVYRASSWPGFWAVFNLAVAVGLLIAGLVSGSRDTAAWAILPGAFAVVALLRHPWRFWIAIDDDGVSSSSGQRSSFADLQVVLPPSAAGSATRPFPIHAVFRGHTLMIPARLDVPSKQVYAALSAHAPRHSSSAIADVMREFRDEQAVMFGDERVWHCRGRSQLGWIREGQAGLNLGLGLMLAGAAALPLAMMPDRSFIGGLGLFGLFFGLLTTVTSLAASRGSKWRKSSAGNGIVVGPLGLAVSQADLVGQLGWDEIRQVVYRLRRRGLRLQPVDDNGVEGIEIHVAGAVIPLCDVYDRSLDVIHERIMSTWKHGPTAGSGASHTDR